MDNLYLFNTIPTVSNQKGFIGTRNGPAKLEDIGLTLIHPFYNERHRFDLQLENWRSWSNYVRDRVKIIIIDDGSPDPVHTYITKNREKYLKYFNFEIYRIKKDLKWNTPGALNLGLTLAKTDWRLIMDSDCAFNGENMEKLLKADPEPFAMYKFPRQRIGSPKEGLHNTRYLPCTILMHKTLFEKFNGFDEDFTGEYTDGYAFFDNDFDRRVNQTGEHPWFIWNEVTATEWMPSTANNEIVIRKKKHERINKKLMYEKEILRRNTLDYRNPSPILRFKWEKTYSNERQTA